ncbi:MAG: phytoene desaturase family protein [Verrucomicrobiota bacterium]|nr:phytoene desaturase family protein [Verrucomicrobiota bacterium]
MEKNQEDSTKKHIIVVGAGPGGLTTAMLLGARGFKVTLLEKADRVGGRSAALDLNGYKFDTGPTFLMMKWLLDEVFEEAGRKSSDYLDFVKLEPMYRLQFADKCIEPTTDRTSMLKQLNETFPGNEKGYWEFLEREQERFEKMTPCFQRDYTSLIKYLSMDLLKALPHLSFGKSVMDVLGQYFNEEELKLAFTFQSKYLGMSAWECPGAFAMLPFVEHVYGVYHTQGGLSEISEAMAKVCREHHVDLRLNAPVKQLILDGRDVQGVELESGERIMGDETILNADFGYAMENLVPPGVLKKYTPEKLERLDYSCSTYMLYLGLDTVYDLPHHTIFFARDYRQNIEDIFQNKRLSSEISFYVRNASITDPGLAPEGHSAVYVLVPVPNLTGETKWSSEKEPFRERLMEALETRAGMKNLRSHIREEAVLTPEDWERMNVYQGATFNLSHKLSQMLYFRPRNKFEELGHCYLVGGGTHPGSGLPTIYESGRIAANLICRQHRVPFVSKNKQV